MSLNLLPLHVIFFSEKLTHHITKLIISLIGKSKRVDFLSFVYLRLIIDAEIIRTLKNVTKRIMEKGEKVLIRRYASEETITYLKNAEKKCPIGLQALMVFAHLSW